MGVVVEWLAARGQYKTGDMTTRFPQLRKNQQRGSKPRCHLLTSGPREEVARRLTSLIEPWGEVKADKSCWMPNGFDNCEEAQLHQAEGIISDPETRKTLLNWWLAVPNATRTTTPNWDIASTCVIHGMPGIFLIEAKAHDAELRNEERGKPLRGEDSKEVSLDSRRNHLRIGCSIQEAAIALSDQTKLVWALSRDCCYQMSNRFAWGWKLTELGMPVILTYLGFLDCEEMGGGADQRPIVNQSDWQQLVESHSQPLFPQEVWNKEWQVHGQSFIPLVRTYRQCL
jgi:hypothetical protein